MIRHFSWKGSAFDRDERAKREALRQQRTELCVSDTDALPRLVPHQCPVEGAMTIEVGQPCNWCGQTEPEPMPAVFRPRNRRAA